MAREVIPVFPPAITLGNRTMGNDGMLFDQFIQY